MKRLLLVLATFAIVGPAVAQQAPTQPSIPLQWNVTVPTTTSISTATYPGNIVLLGSIQSKVYTVATLPTCNAATAGNNAAVSDATAPTYNAALTGGGAVGVPVYCNGTSWTSH